MRLKLAAITLKASCSNIQQNEAGNMMKIETKLQKMKGNKLLMD